MQSKGGILTRSECFIFTLVVGATLHLLSEMVLPTILDEKLAIHNLCETWFQLIALTLQVSFYLELKKNRLVTF